MTKAQRISKFIRATAKWPSPFDGERIAIIRAIADGVKVDVGVGTYTMLRDVMDKDDPNWMLIGVREVGQ